MSFGGRAVIHYKVDGGILGFHVRGKRESFGKAKSVLKIGGYFVVKTK